MSYEVTDEVEIIIDKMKVISTLKIKIRYGVTSIYRNEDNVSLSPSVLEANGGLPMNRLYLAGRRLRSLTNVPITRRLSHATLLNVLTIHRTVTSTGVSFSRQIKLISSASMNNVSLARHFFRRFVRGSSGKHLHSIEVRSYTTNARTVIHRYKVGNCSAAVDATYSSTTGTIVAKTGLLGRRIISYIIINNYSTLDTFALGNFGSLVVLSRRPYHPFSTKHSNLGLNRNTNCVMLRHRRSIHGHCYCLTNFTGHGSTGRRATSSTRKGKTCLTVARTVRVTKVTPRRVNCVGIRNAKAKGGSTSRDTTLVQVFKSGIPPFDSAGKFAKRALTTTNNIRTILSTLTMGRNCVCPGLGFSAPVSTCKLMPRARFGSNRTIRCILAGSFNFKKGYASLVFNGWKCRILCERYNSERKNASQCRSFSS